MKETKIYADEFCTTFASTTEMLEFLAERAKQSKWIRKPTRMLKLVPLEKEAETIEEACEKELEGIVEDTEKNTQLVLKVNKDFYPVRDCAIHTILKRAGINGTGLKKLEKATYAKVVNYCLQVAKGDALIKVADGKVSAVHGGDDHDYCVLDMQTIFNMTSDYLKAHFKGSTYLEGSGSFDHSIVSAMWTLGGNQELLDTYHQALEDHGIEDKSLAPALRLTTSDVAVSGVNLYPMMLSQTSNRVINLGSPIKLSHDRGATLQDFRNNLDKIFSRYQEAVKGIVGLMDIDIQNPVNCLHLIMKELKINQKIRNEVVELFVGQYGEEPCTAHDLYFAMHEAAFFAACEGFSAPRILKLEEDIAKTLVFDWKGFDVYTFICVAGVNQYRNLKPVLETLKSRHLQHLYEAYDMDKKMKVYCDGDSEKCDACQRKPATFYCPHKMQKRQILQNACRKVYEICSGLSISMSRMVWDMDSYGEWNGQIKGIDDYYYVLKNTG